MGDFLCAVPSRPKIPPKVSKDEDDDLWGSIAAPAPKTASKPLNVKTAGAVDDDDPWAAIAAPPTHNQGQTFISWQRQRSQTRCSEVGSTEDKPDILIRDVNVLKARAVKMKK